MYIDSFGENFSLKFPIFNKSNIKKNSKNEDYFVLAGVGTGFNSKLASVPD